MAHPPLTLLLIFMLASSAAAAEPETLARFEKCSPEEGCALPAAGGTLKFYPQALERSGETILLLNRFEPALVAVAPGGGAPAVTRLSQPADKKFDARYFTDLALVDGTLYLMEQSTATLREVEPNGKVGDVYVPSDTEGQTIERFHPLGGGRFLFVDEGQRRLLLRSLDEIRDIEAPDTTGATFAFNGEGCLASTAGILTLERNGGTLEALLSPAEETEEVSLAAAYPSGAKVTPLDADATGSFYLYVETTAEAALERFDTAKRPAVVERTCWPRLAFARAATRPARLAPGGMLLLLERGDDVLLARLPLAPAK